MTSTSLAGSSSGKRSKLMQPHALAQAKSQVADELSPCLSCSSFLRPYSSLSMRHNAPCVSTRMLTIGKPPTPERKKPFEGNDELRAGVKAKCGALLAS